MDQYQKVNIIGGCKLLVNLITDFIGPEFRLLDGEYPPVFAARKVYGDDSDDERERALRGR